MTAKKERGVGAGALLNAMIAGVKRPARSRARGTDKPSVPDAISRDASGSQHARISTNQGHQQSRLPEPVLRQHCRKPRQYAGTNIFASRRPAPACLREREARLIAPPLVASGNSIRHRRNGAAGMVAIRRSSRQNQPGGIHIAKGLPADSK